MNESEARKLIVEVGRLMYERSYVVASDGNVSILLDDGRVLATPTMTSKGRMTVDSIAVTDVEGNSLSDKRASSELAMHLLIYKMRPTSGRFVMLIRRTEPLFQLPVLRSNSRFFLKWC